MTRRFVVQQHTVSERDVHYDLMIEADDVLVTIQLDRPPLAGSGGRRSFDHRRLYLDYEGEISGGRGAVAIWDRGEVQDLQGTPRSPLYVGQFAGGRLLGAFTLRDLEDGVALEPGAHP